MIKHMIVWPFGVICDSVSPQKLLLYVTKYLNPIIFILLSSSLVLSSSITFFVQHDNPFLRSRAITFYFVWYIFSVYMRYRTSVHSTSFENYWHYIWPFSWIHAFYVPISSKLLNDYMYDCLTLVLIMWTNHCCNIQ